MKAFKEAFSFIYRYYNVYFMLIPIWVSAGLTLYFYLKRKKKRLLATVICTVISFIFCTTVVYLYKLVCYTDTKAVESAFIKETLIAVVSGPFISFAICRLCHINFHRIKEFYQKNSWGILLFTVLFLEFIFNKSENLKPWGSCWYGVNYSMGIGSRFFIGTFLNIITGGKVSTGIAYFFCEATLVALIVCVAYLANAVIKKAEMQGENGAIIFLVLCFVSSPGSIAGLWTEGNMGRLETYTLLIALLSVVLFWMIKKDGGRYIGITVLSIIAVAVYQGYVFLYFPIVFTVMLCDIFKETNGKRNKIIYGISACFCVAVAFLFFQFMSFVNFSTAGEMAEALRNSSDLNVSEAAIQYEFFSSIAETYNVLNKPFLIGNGEYPREKTLLLIMLMVPLVLIISGIYAVCIKEVTKNKETVFKCPYIYCLASNLAVLPQFILNVDWGRWMLAVTINLFFQIFYLYYMDFKEMRMAIKRLNLFVARNKALAVMCLLYLTIFDKFEDRIYFGQIEKLWEHFAGMLNL